MEVYNVSQGHGYPHSDNAGNAKMSGDKTSAGAWERHTLVDRASPGGVSHGWDLTAPVITYSWS